MSAASTAGDVEAAGANGDGVIAVPHVVAGDTGRPPPPGPLRGSRSLVLLINPSDQQSGKLAAKVFGYEGALRQPIGSRKRTELPLHSVNGGRAIALPKKNEKAIRGFLGARLLVVDKTSRVSDAL